jgi:23S rRNA (uridine2552-2'-O)-methyltransferase
VGKTKTWIRQRKQEYYYKKAKTENYRSRATYKLAQAIAKYHFIKFGNVVVDLGAAPGGWIQATRKVVTKKGFVLGVDLKPIAPFEQAYIRTIVCDMTDSEAIKEIMSFLPGKADVVISDMSPNISGVWEVDHERQIDLATKALNVATQILCQGGNFFTKVFEGSQLKGYIEKVKKQFEEVKLIKPPASRAQSSEIYILALGLKVPEPEESKPNFSKTPQ